VRLLRMLAISDLRERKYAREAIPIADRPATPPKADSGPVSGRGVVEVPSTCPVGVGVADGITEGVTEGVGVGVAVMFTVALQAPFMYDVPRFVTTWPYTVKLPEVIVWSI
jgi:hypothetical protein